jgi:hypothetical protein
MSISVAAALHRFRSQFVDISHQLRGTQNGFDERFDLDPSTMLRAHEQDALRGGKTAMSKVQLLALTILTTWCSPGLAQDAKAPLPPTPASCWLAGIEFSPGSYIRTGDTVSLCRLDGTWRPADKSAAGCLRDGELFALGSAVTTGDGKSSKNKQTCQKNGTWS